MSSVTLQKRLANLRAANSSFPLWAFLALYNKSRRECYVNYFEGAKLLKDWLGEIAIPNFQDRSIPSLLWGYESQELCKAISGETFICSPVYRKTAVAVFTIMLNARNR